MHCIGCTFMVQVDIQAGGYQPVYRTAVVGYMPDGVAF